MTVTFQQLVELLDKSAFADGETPAKQALYIQFDAKERKADETINYTATDETGIAIDVNGNGDVIGIELW